MQATIAQPRDLEQARQISRQAGEIFSAGGLVVFPTETVYGLGASAASTAGYDALMTIKGNPEGRPFTVHLPNPTAAERYVDTSSPMLRRLMHKVFPGPVTLVVDVTDEFIEAAMRRMRLPAEARGRLYHQNTIALRCPDDAIAQLILDSIDAPIVAGAANRPGDPAPHDAADAAAWVGDKVGLVVDGGPTRFAKPSTLVRVSGSGNDTKITVEREGVYDQRFIQKLMRWTMLLICSGNTCRSPMAEGLARQILAQQRKIAVGDLDAAGLRVISAGAYASPGMPATREAVEVVKKMGVDLTGHRSKMLLPELIHESDVIYCMSESHRDAVVGMSAAARDKTFLLDESGDIEDPIGSDISAYQRCAERIRRQLDQRLKEQQP